MDGSITSNSDEVMKSFFMVFFSNLTGMAMPFGHHNLIANHTSMFDIMAIMSFNPRVSWFGQEKLLKVPLFGTMLKMIDYIPMRLANVRNT
ncbi:1-acyl-sn-glycerol-3-phosphate acyltransferase, partial [Bacteroidota bacterium]